MVEQPGQPNFGRAPFGGCILIGIALPQCEPRQNTVRKQVTLVSNQVAVYAER